MKATGAIAAVLLAVLISSVPTGSSAADTSHLGGHAETSGMYADYDADTGLLQFRIQTEAERFSFTILSESGRLMGPYTVGNENNGFVLVEGFRGSDALDRGMNLISLSGGQSGIAEFRMDVRTACTVSFDPNGAKGILPFVSVSPGGTCVLPDCTLRSPTQSPFGGWEIHGETHQKGDRIQVTADTVAKAVWGGSEDSSPMLWIVVAVVLVTAIAIILTVRRMRN